MGYESKVIIARKYDWATVPETIAEINLCGMPNGFYNLFDKEWEHGILEHFVGEVIHKDKYDKVITYAELDKVLMWALRNFNLDHYRRTGVLIATLTAVRQGWGDDEGLIVIHYGY